MRGDGSRMRAGDGLDDGQPQSASTALSGFGIAAIYEERKRVLKRGSQRSDLPPSSPSVFPVI